ncbi:hypothetical protein [Pseudobythopirellula maris]|nr:hypothetical protein [Pseudobythopirellula maris]
MTIIEMAADKIGGTIRKGKAIPVLIGSVLGLVLGGLSAWAMGAGNFGYYIGFSLLGSLCASLVSASIFTRPPSPPENCDWLGKVLSSWILTEKTKTSTLYSCYAVTENAIVRLFQNCYPGSTTPDFDEWIRLLESGVMPDASATHVYSLEGLECLEFTPGSHFVTLFCEQNDHSTSSTIDCGDENTVMAFIKSIETARNIKLEDSYRAMRLGEAILFPCILFSIAILFVTGIAWLSHHWILHPPQPPRGKPEGDELVRFLTWAGPEKIALFGLIPVGFAATWLIKRVYHRPQVRVLSPVSASL